MRIVFLHGTETGTAEIVSEDLQASVSGAHETEIASLEDVTPDTLENGPLYVFVCSTFGSGDLPSTAEEFVSTLKQSKPDLSHVSFAVFGLGDRSFGDTFNQGSEQVMQAMTACKARMVGERGIADASADDLPEDVAVPWLEGILAKV
ncbi:MAG: flavodoxin domain-containing protein [Pseudomonadota bacterium]